MCIRDRWLDTEKASIAFESEQGQDTSCALTRPKGETMDSEKVYNMEFAKLYPLLDVYKRQLIPHPADFDNKDKWSEQFDWAMDVALKMKNAFKKYL